MQKSKIIAPTRVSRTRTMKIPALIAIKFLSQASSSENFYTKSQQRKQKYSRTKEITKAYQVNELTHDDFIYIKISAATIGKNFSRNTGKEVVKITDIKIWKVELDGAED